LTPNVRGGTKDDPSGLLKDSVDQVNSGKQNLGWLSSQKPAKSTAAEFKKSIITDRAA